MKRLLTVVAVAALLVAGLAPTPAQARTPNRCSLKAGRYTVTPVSPQTIDLAVVSLVCDPTDKVVVTVKSLRFWVATKTWTVERVGNPKTFIGTVPDFVYPFHCDVPGALMTDLVLYTRFIGGRVVSVHHEGQDMTALCPH